MLISVFEAKGFKNWCSNDINKVKQSIFSRAHKLLMSTVLSRKKTKVYLEGKDFFDKHLDTIEFSYKSTDLDEKIFNTSLADQCLNIIYDKDKLDTICYNELQKIPRLIEYIDDLSMFIIDSAIVEWKMDKSLPLRLLKVDNPYNEFKGFFPISENLYDLIRVIQSLTEKTIVFKPQYKTSPSINRKTIECYFSDDRLVSEYLIEQQLFEVYMYIKNYPVIDKSFFADMSNWKYDKDTLEKAVLIILQNKFTNLLSSEVYPIFINPKIYRLLNFKCSDEHMGATYRYLCAFFKKNRLCFNCSGIEDIFDHGDACPLYSNESIVGKFFTLDELATPEKQIECCRKYIEDILEREI